jgi:hypothetical protein
MTILQIIRDPFGARRIAQRDADLAKADRRIARLEGCKETLDQLNKQRTADLNTAHVHMDRAAVLDIAVRKTLIEELAQGTVDGLAGGWALKLADELADRAGMDLRPEIHRLIGEHRLPDLPVGGEAAREAPQTRGQATAGAPVMPLHDAPRGGEL